MKLTTIIITILLVISTVAITTAFFDLEGDHTQWSDDIHGTVIEKRVDSYGDGFPKMLDYILIMYDGNDYYEAVVSFKKYARVKVGDTL